MNYYFLYRENNKKIVGYVNNDSLEDIFERIEESNKDKIYISRVVKEFDAINGYIIEIEKGIKGCIEKKQLIGNIKPGDEILVQLYKKTSVSKLDKYTMNYSIAGKNLVYYPNRYKNLFSKKINIDKLVNLKEITKKNNFLKGITFRTSSENAKEKELINEYESLKKINNYIVTRTNFLPIPRKIYGNIKDAFEFINKEFDYIITNDKEEYNILKEYYINKNINYDENYNYNYDENITKDLINIKSKIIEISENANIVIDETEALTVVDINSGKDVDFLEINKLAVSEMIKQVNLRKIQGIIIVDIINLKKAEEYLLEKYIENILKNYPKIKYYGITNTGLLEFIKTGINIDI